MLLPSMHGCYADVSDDEYHPPVSAGCAPAAGDQPQSTRPVLHSKSVPAAAHRASSAATATPASSLTQRARNRSVPPSQTANKATTTSRGARDVSPIVAGGGHGRVHGAVHSSKQRAAHNAAAPVPAATAAADDAWHVANAAAPADVQHPASVPVRPTSQKQKKVAAARAVQTPPQTTPQAAPAAPVASSGSWHMHAAEDGRIFPSEEEEEDPSDPLRRCELCRCASLAPACTAYMFSGCTF